MPPEEGGEGNDGRILSPSELDLEDKDGVEQIEEGRFVVSPDGTRPDVPDVDPDPDSRPEPDSDPETPTTTDSPDPEITREDVREWTTEQLGGTACDYGYHLSLKVGDSVDHHTLHSDDVATVFNNLMLWYAQSVDGDLPPGAVLGILLMEASVPVRYPVRSIEQFLLSHGLSPEDSIADLLEAVREDEEVVFPPPDA